MDEYPLKYILNEKRFGWKSSWANFWKLPIVTVQKCQYSKNMLMKNTNDSKYISRWFPNFVTISFVFVFLDVHDPKDSSQHHHTLPRRSRTRKETVLQSWKWYIWTCYQLIISSAWFGAKGDVWLWLFYVSCKEIILKEMDPLFLHRPINIKSCIISFKCWLQTWALKRWL